MCVYDTAPHVVDPVNPGAVDEILNMGQCWNEEGFKHFRRNIIDINKEVGRTFRRAYRYIGAAKLVHDDWSNFNSEALNISKLNNLKEELKDKILTTPVSHSGFDRHLFATAFTPDGIVTYVDTIYSNYKDIYVLNGGPGTGKSDILDYISKEALKRGHYVEIYHDPLIPDRIEHIFIPDLSTAILTSNEINQKQFNGYQVYMDTVLNTYVLNKNRDEIKQSSESFYQLLNKGLEIISHAKQLHDQMETYYIPNMNFNKVNEVSDTVINKILQYEKEYLEKK